MTESLTDISNEALLALRRGEEWAYRELHACYAGPVKEFLASIIRNDEDARELVHDIFVDLWLNREKVDPEKSIRGYLYVSAKNRAMNWFAHKKVREKYEAFCSWEDSDYTLPVDEGMIARETEALTQIALRGMSKRKQAIWRMSRDEGMSNQEIAKELNISISTVTHNLTDIKRHIREILAMFTLFFLS
jgi:RNA polymerase sigma-70 factor (ECF subfamily)